MPLAPLVIWLNQLVEIRTDFVKCLDIFRRPSPRKVARIGMWESCLWFQTFTNVIQMVAVAAFGTLMLDDWAGVLGYTPQTAPQLFETHGRETHLRRDVKVVVCVVLVLVGLGVVALVLELVGARTRILPVSKRRKRIRRLRQKSNKMKADRTCMRSMHARVYGVMLLQHGAPGDRNQMSVAASELPLARVGTTCTVSLPV
eukprot:5591888-Pleurochrysis_carterae.AAC.1